MGIRLSDSVVKRLPAPTAGNKVYYNSKGRDSGARVTAAGARSFICPSTIGPASVGRGASPSAPFLLGQPRRHVPKPRCSKGASIAVRILLLKSRPAAQLLRLPTFATATSSSISPRSGSVRGAMTRNMIAKRILPALGAIKVSDVTFSNIDGLHRKITRGGTPIRANRVAALLSKMFSVAIKLQMRSDNPCRGVEDATERTSGRDTSQPMRFRG